MYKKRVAEIVSGVKNICNIEHTVPQKVKYLQKNNLLLFFCLNLD